MRDRLSRIRKAGLLVIGGLAASQAAAGTLVELFREDWESFTLFPNLEEGIFTGPERIVKEAFFGDANDSVPFDGTWTANGWVQTFAPAGVGTAEWEGWSIANRDFWINSDFQLREEFTKASGAVAVADPDEWDDFDPILDDPESAGLYNTSLRSPVISLSGTEANSVVLTFDSSWRPEDNQQVRLSVRFNGGAWQELLYWNSFEGDPNFKPDATNETVVVNIANPEGASNMELFFEMFDAGNDWWWAIDNIVVAGEGGDPVLPPTPFSLSTDTFYPDTTPSISWSQSVNATQYEVIFANNPDFTGIDVQVLVDGDTFSYEPGTGVLNAGVYFVKVIARNTIGTSEQSATIGLDNPCLGDVNGDGAKDFFDVQNFLNVLSAGCGG
jgi:hypothetical protein